jgi:LAO/AO transport system kinase
LDSSELVRRVLGGERLALARLLTAVENDTAVGRAALDEIFPYTGKAHLVGITGAPGTGKSSLANQLARVLRRRDASAKVAVLAVDPSSPFTGGALLGDRLRMKDAAADPGVFIRSMASRGTLGGLARTTAAAAQVLDAAGYAVVLIETVGAGQSEVDIMRLAHTVLLVDAPGLGDDIQAIKAGILEIADVLVVNKADQPGVENTLRALRLMLDLAYPEGSETPGAQEGSRWRPPLLRATATSGEGIEAIVDAICQHKEYLKSGDGWKRREWTRVETEFDGLLRAELVERWKRTIGPERLEGVMARLAAKQISPQKAVEELLGLFH